MRLVERALQRVYILYHTRHVLTELLVVTNRGAFRWERDLTERCSKLEIDPAPLLT